MGFLASLMSWNYRQIWQMAAATLMIGAVLKHCGIPVMMWQDAVPGPASWAPTQVAPESGKTASPDAETILTRHREAIAAPLVVLPEQPGELPRDHLDAYVRQRLHRAGVWAAPTAYRDLIAKTARFHSAHTPAHFYIPALGANGITRINIVATRSRTDFRRATANTALLPFRRPPRISQSSWQRTVLLHELGHVYDLQATWRGMPQLRLFSRHDPATASQLVTWRRESVADAMAVLGTLVHAGRTEARRLADMLIELRSLRVYADLMKGDAVKIHHFTAPVLNRLRSILDGIDPTTVRPVETRYILARRVVRAAAREIDRHDVEIASGAPGQAESPDVAGQRRNGFRLPPSWHQLLADTVGGYWARQSCYWPDPDVRERLHCADHRMGTMRLIDPIKPRPADLDRFQVTRTRPRPRTSHPTDAADSGE